MDTDSVHQNSDGVEHEAILGSEDCHDQSAVAVDGVGRMVVHEGSLESLASWGSEAFADAASLVMDLDDFQCPLARAQWCY